MAPKSAAGAGVAGYIAAAPPAARPMLRQLRRIVRTHAPRAVEKLSYGMPYYDHHGRLIYFAAFTKHVSVFAMGRSKARFAAETKPYRITASTLQFPYGTKLPAGLIARLVRARVREIEGAE
jgi:uncharacterized protein YdhG (YjbR/CyaY superfamily)